MIHCFNQLSEQADERLLTGIGGIHMHKQAAAAQKHCCFEMTLRGSITGEEVEEVDTHRYVFTSLQTDQTRSSEGTMNNDSDLEL